jgi:hypothetical protein
VDPSNITESECNWKDLQMQEEMYINYTYRWI